MRNKNEELKRKLKKAASISLCAVLAGGLAAGTYTGVNYLTGYEQSVQAASEDKVELLKSCLLYTSILRQRLHVQLFYHWHEANGKGNFPGERWKNDLKYRRRSDPPPLG